MKGKKSFSKRYNLKWVGIISIWTFILSIIFNLITDGLVSKLDILPGFLVLIAIILIGIFFDIIGVAVTTAIEKPFHAMAANKVAEAKYAIRLVRNASQVSNFCNDVIGDISGIVSGAVGTTIIYKLISKYSINDTLVITVGLTSLIAAMTVGGKAFGKAFAMMYSEKIIFETARVLNFLDDKLNIEIIKDKKKKTDKNKER